MNLSAEDIDEIAERAARRVLTMEYGEPPMTVAEHAAKAATASFYEGVGRAVVKKILWVVGVGALVLATWLAGKGHLQG